MASVIIGREIAVSALARMDGGDRRARPDQSLDPGIST